MIKEVIERAFGGTTIALPQKTMLTCHQLPHTRVRGSMKIGACLTKYIRQQYKEPCHRIVSRLITDNNPAFIMISQDRETMAIKARASTERA
jgi:hypothetical protein